MALAWSSGDEGDGMVEMQRWGGLVKAWAHLVTTDGQQYVDMRVQPRQQYCYRMRRVGSEPWSGTQCTMPK